MPRSIETDPGDSGKKIDPHHKIEFDSYYRDNRDSAVKFAWALCALKGINSADGDECAAEALWVIYTQWPIFREYEESHKRAFLRCVIRNQCKTRVRTEYRRRARFWSAPMSELETLGRRRQLSKAGDLSSRDLVILEIVATFPLRDQEILLKEESDKVLAQQLAMTTNAVRKRRSALRKKLRKLLEGQGE